MELKVGTFYLHHTIETKNKTPLERVFVVSYTLNVHGILYSIAKEIIPM